MITGTEALDTQDQVERPDGTVGGLEGYPLPTHTETTRAVQFAVSLLEGHASEREFAGLFRYDPKPDDWESLVAAELVRRGCHLEPIKAHYRDGYRITSSVRFGKLLTRQEVKASHLVIVSGCLLVIGFNAVLILPALIGGYLHLRNDTIAMLLGVTSCTIGALFRSKRGERIVAGCAGLLVLTAWALGWLR